MAVHGKFGKPCPVCGQPVQRIVYARNEANYCSPVPDRRPAAVGPGAVAAARAGLAENAGRAGDRRQSADAEPEPIRRRFHAFQGMRNDGLLFSGGSAFNGVGALGIAVQLGRPRAAGAARRRPLSRGDGHCRRSGGAAQFLLAPAVDVARPAGGGPPRVAGRLAAFTLLNGFISLAGNLVLMRLLTGRSASIRSPPTSPR